MLTRFTIHYIACSLVTAIAASCTQPVPNCTSAHGTYAAEYRLTDGDLGSPCGQLRGDVLGLQTYFQEGGKNGTPDYQNAMVAIRAQSMGEMIIRATAQGTVDADAVWYDASAIGKFTAGFPNDDSFCMAEGFDEARITLPEVPAVPDDPTTMDVDEALPVQPAIDATYRWRDARFVVSADAQGTQFEAELEYTQDGCSATYHVVAVYPAVACQTDEQCQDEKNGINPDFALRCNTDLGLCVLSEDPPAYE